MNQNSAIHDWIPLTPPKPSGVSLALLLLGATLSGCGTLATGTSPDQEVGIEREHSSHGRITAVYLWDLGDGILVSGRVEAVPPGRRGKIPGCVTVQVLDASGEVLDAAVTDYRRLSRRSGTAAFSEELAVPHERVRAIRVAHERTDCTGVHAVAGS